MNHPILRYAGLHALATGLYVALVASLLFLAGHSQIEDTILIPIGLLLLFILSASVTGALVLGRPILWYLDGKKHEAVSLFMATLGFLALIVFVIGCVFAGIAISQKHFPKESRTEQPLAPKQKILETSADPNSVFGFIRSLDTRNGTLSIEFDQAEFIKNSPATPGQEPKLGAADFAAIEDGVCDAKINEVPVRSCAPNGFYIRNNSTTTKSFLLTLSTKITVLAQASPANDSIHPQSLTVNNFQKAFLKPPSAYNDPFYALVDGPYQITLKNGRVTELKSVYLP